MLFRPFLATLLAAAPSGVAAFGDLDCIGTETCSDGTCRNDMGVLVNYPLVFDWDAQTVTFPFDDTIMVLPIVGQDTSATSPSGQMAFGNPQGTALLLNFSGFEIAATLTLEGSTTVHRATCAPQEAA